MKLSDEVKKLEARTYYEQNYDEYEVEDLMDIYERVMSHVGFTDNRRDSRFIVKFHDIFYCWPDEEKECEGTLDALFEDFCTCTYEDIMDTLRESNIDIRSLTSSRPCGHYDAFIVDVPEITKDNAIELAEKIYIEVGNGGSYIDDYVFVVNMLQALEDNYMDEWIDFIDGGLPKRVINKIKKAYEAEKKRKEMNK